MKDFHLVKGESFVFLLLLTVNLYVKNFKLIVPRVNCLDIKKKKFPPHLFIPASLSFSPSSPFLLPSLQFVLCFNRLTHNTIP